MNHNRRGSVPSLAKPPTDVTVEKVTTLMSDEELRRALWRAALEMFDEEGESDGTCSHLPRPLVPSGKRHEGSTDER